MKDLIKHVGCVMEASQKDYEDALNDASSAKRRQMMRNAKPEQNDPSDPMVLVRGFGRMKKSQAEKLKMNYEAFDPVATYGYKGQSAQSMAGSMQRGPTQQEMLKAQKHVADKHDPGHKIVGVSVGLDGKTQVKSAITQTSIVGEPVKKNPSNVKESHKLDVPTMSPEKIAEKHGVSLADIDAQLKKGIAVEKEHTTDETTAREIALDHIGEDPKYYDKLATIEENADYDAINKIHAATKSYGIQGRDVTTYSGGRAVARNQRTRKYHSINSKGEVGTHHTMHDALAAIKESTDTDDIAVKGYNIEESKTLGSTPKTKERSRIRMKELMMKMIKGTITKDQASYLKHVTKSALSPAHGGMREETELEEAKWVTPPSEPATNLKRGDIVSVQHPTKSSTMLHGTYLRSAEGSGKPGHPNGHLIKLHSPLEGSGTALHWAKPEHVFRKLEDGWKSPQKVNEMDEQDTQPEEQLDEVTDDLVIKAGAHKLKGLRGKELLDTMKRIRRDIERSRYPHDQRTGPILK